MTRIIYLFFFISFSFSNSPINNFIIGFWPEYDHPGVLVSIQIESDPSELPYNFKLDVPSNSKMVIETIIEGDNRNNNVLSVEYDEVLKNSYINSQIKEERYLLQFYYNPFDLSVIDRKIEFVLKSNIDLADFYIVIQKHLGSTDYSMNLNDLETIEDAYGITYYRKKINSLMANDSFLIKIDYKNSMNNTSMDILNSKQEKINLSNNNDGKVELDGSNKYNSNKFYILATLLTTTILVLLLYYFYNKDSQNLNQYFACLKCNKLINKTDRFCSFCGGENVS